MAFNSYNLIVRIYLNNGQTKDVYCKTLQEARMVLATSKSEIVGNY